jgi:hypothetical protein
MIAQDCVPLSQHDLLAADECAAVAQRIEALRPHWQPRSQGSFFSLGTAAYLDAPGRREAYLVSARRTNPVLLGAFLELQNRVAHFLEELLDETVVIDTERAVPGFHIFLLDGTERGRDEPARRAHFDLQWRDAYPGSVPTGTLSFTLPIETPSGGASMAVWDMHYRDALRGANSGEYATRHRPRQIAYTPGRLVLHDGLVLHAIGAAGEPRPRGRRITLQGHAARIGPCWRLYW